MNTGIEALKGAIGTQFSDYTDIAKRIGRTPQAVSEVMRRSKRVPAEWCLLIEDATQGAITRHQLRPDLYPLETTQ